MKIQLKGREIPRNDKGDPHFTTLGVTQEEWDFTYKEYAVNGVLTVFTVGEVVELVNRALYQLEYQHESHRVRGQEQRDREKRVREKVRELYHISWLKATPEQVKRATEEVEREPGKGG